MPAAFEEELDQLVKEGILEPIQFSEWAAPLVLVVKSDHKSVLTCGDFKLTVNQASKLDWYPIPWMEDLFTQLAGGKVFSKLDLSQAYQQVLLDEESQDYTVINTQRGLFRYCRLPFGISSAPGTYHPKSKKMFYKEYLKSLSTLMIFWWQEEMRQSIWVFWTKCYKDWNSLDFVWRKKNATSWCPQEFIGYQIDASIWPCLAPPLAQAGAGRHCTWGTSHRLTCGLRHKKPVLAPQLFQYQCLITHTSCHFQYGSGKCFTRNT